MQSIQRQNLLRWSWNSGVTLLCFLVLLADIYSPLGEIFWILYVAVVAFTLFSPSVQTNIIALLLSTGFIILGYWDLFGTWDAGRSVINRVIGLILLWIVSFAVFRSKSYEQKINYASRVRTLEAGLATKLASELELIDFSKSVLDFFMTHTNALVGAFYVQKEKDQLELAMSSGTNSAPQIVRESGSLLWQRMQKPEVGHFEDVTSDHISVDSSLGSSKAAHLLFIPFRYNGTNRGILELGSFQHFTEETLEFAEKARDMLGQALAASLYAEELEEAFKQKSTQAEELQAQQEELRVANEELEAQSNALKNSQAELETQTAELEQQQSMMEERNEELKVRNMELQRIRRDLESAAGELHEANRYKSEFLSNMSHELRTPINSMLILSQLLGENKGERLNAEEVEFAKTITSSGNDLLNLINEILDLSKVEAGMMELHIEQISVQSITERMDRFFSPMAEKRGIKFNVESAVDSNFLIKSDQKRVEQILKNLISNAVKFTSDGSVTLKVELDEQIHFRVIDTGTGIPEDKKDKIFRAFEQVDGTTSRKYGGTGLGLSIVTELTQLLQGQIDLESHVGEGSTFTLSLPFQIDADAAEPTSVDRPQKIEIPRLTPFQPAQALESNPNREAERLKENTAMAQMHHGFKDDRDQIHAKDRVAVIIEDDEVFAKTLLRIAREMEFKCICCATGADGIEQIEKFKPTAVLLDMRLPDTNGLTVLEYIKGSPTLRHIPVHVVSAVSYEQNALAMGAVGYLQKPTSADDIRGAFRRVEKILAKEIKHVLIVEDDPIQREALKHLVSSPSVETIAVGEIKKALEVIKSTSLDCLIIDLRLPDGSGLDLLKMISELENIEKPPVIVYTGKDLTRDEEIQLKQYSESIIIKGARSPERLLAETTLFLHRVERELPHEKQKMLREVRERSDSLKGRTVLLVDDDVRNVFALSAALEGQGLTVHAARNGRDAIEKLHANDTVEIILMDIMMPEMDGYEAMTEIRKEAKYKSLPIIALTAKAMKGDDIRCLEAGANDYLSKPVDLDKLLSLMRVWLSSKSGF